MAAAAVSDFVLQMMPFRQLLADEELGLTVIALDRGFGFALVFPLRLAMLTKNAIPQAA